MKNRFTQLLPSAVLGLLTALAGSAALADTIDPNTPDGFVQVSRKIQCSLNDEEPVTFTWSGRAYARVPGERDKHVFNLEGMNVRQCVTLDDEKRGKGYRLVSREIMLYLDPKTNQVLRTWENPWTGAGNEVIHVANDPVNGRPNFGRDKEGNSSARPLKEINGTWFMNFEVPLFYTNPLAGDYQKYVGGTYHATEIFDFNGDVDELLSPDQPIAYPAVSWVRIAKWLPWMEMGDRTGILYFNAVGKKLESWDQLPEVMQEEIAANYPEYTAPPPVDDTRPNETSWTNMKKIIDSRPKEESIKGH
jgi:hypothetical protein